ncbi:MAG: hypothetical protein FWD74_04085 [Actinomycetia bacterium]|nr:hypothetical protein [Actinomycetes bacterium]
MANLTLVIDDAVLRRARVRAIQEDTSVNAQVREFLAAYATHSDNSDDARQRQAAARLVELSRAARSGGGLADRAWSRDDLHER